MLIFFWGFFIDLCNSEEGNPSKSNLTHFKAAGTIDVFQVIKRQSV